MFEYCQKYFGDFCAVTENLMTIKTLIMCIDSLRCQVRSGDHDYSCSMLLYHVISTTCSHAGGWGSTALAGHSSRSMLVFTQN